MKKKMFAVIMAAIMTISSAVSVFAVELTDSIKFDLTVTGFFAEKTDAVALKSGDSHTFKFRNKSNGDGTKNYENYVMAITGAIGEDYTGTPEEILIIRADNWGWGGAMSDFAAPDAESGNKLSFQSDVNFDDWGRVMTAGADCEVTISRDGDTLHYTAKIGDWTTTLDATSGLALPETCYVFFTGENCTLSELASAPVEDSTDESTTAAPSTNTGDNSAAVGMILIAFAAAVTAVILKNRAAVE